MSSQHDQNPDAVQHEEQVTPLSLVVVPNPLSSSVQVLAPEDAAPVRYQRKKKRPAHLDEFIDPNIERIIRSHKQLHEINHLQVQDPSQLKIFRTFIQGRTKRKELYYHTGSHNVQWFKEYINLKTWLYDSVCIFTIMVTFQLMCIFLSY